MTLSNEDLNTLTAEAENHPWLIESITIEVDPEGTIEVWCGVPKTLLFKSRPETIDELRRDPKRLADIFRYLGEKLAERAGSYYGSPGTAPFGYECWDHDSLGVSHDLASGCPAQEHPTLHRDTARATGLPVARIQPPR